MMEDEVKRTKGRVGQTVLQRSECLEVPIWATAAAVLAGSDLHGSLATYGRECGGQGRNNHTVLLAPYHLCDGALV